MVITFFIRITFPFVCIISYREKEGRITTIVNKIMAVIGPNILAKIAQDQEDQVGGIEPSPGGIDPLPNGETTAARCSSRIVDASKKAAGTSIDAGEIEKLASISTTKPRKKRKPKRAQGGGKTSSAKGEENPTDGSHAGGTDADKDAVGGTDDADEELIEVIDVYSDASDDDLMVLGHSFANLGMETGKTIVDRSYSYSPSQIQASGFGGGTGLFSNLRGLRAPSAHGAPCL